MRRLLLAIAALLVCTCAHAQVQTKSYIDNLTASLIPDNNTNAVSPANVRSVLNVISASMCGIAVPGDCPINGVNLLGLNNVWTGTNTFDAAVNVVEAAGASVPAFSVTTADHSAFSVPGAQIIANVDYGSFGDANTTVGFAVVGGKNLDATATTGSWQLFTARYEGFGGGDSSAFITAGQELMKPTVGSNNNSGHFFGNNPEVLCPASLTPAECTAEEADIRTAFSGTISDRHGLRIVDLGSTGSYATDDSGLSILSSSSGIGFSNLIELGSQSGQFPGVAGGNLLETAASSTVLASLMDFSHLTGANPGILFSVQNGSLYFGSAASWPGGRLKSATGSAGPDIEFGSGFVVINTNGDTAQIASFGISASTIDAPLTLVSTLKLSNAANFTAVTNCGSLASSTKCLSIIDSNGNTMFAPLYGTF